MLQNATPLRKWAPWPPNISHKHVFCTAPATENASLQILFKRPTPAIVFQLLQNPHTTCRIHCACHAEPHPKLKKCPRTASFNTFDFEMRFAPQRRALFRHLNFQKCSEAEAFCAFWLGNVLRATTACTFWTSQVPKMFPMCFLCILTWKFASRHNNMHFLSISISKSTPNIWCF